jgi:NADH-quinone oxidoreductase subunit M
MINRVNRVRRERRTKKKKKMKILLLIPIIGSIIISVMPTEREEDKRKLKKVALITSILTLLEGIRIWIGLEEGTESIQLIYKLEWYGGEGILFGVDGISIIYLLLTVLIFPICILASWDSIKILQKQYWIINIIKMSFTVKECI